MKQFWFGDDDDKCKYSRKILHETLSYSNKINGKRWIRMIKYISKECPNSMDFQLINEEINQHLKNYDEEIQNEINQGFTCKKDSSIYIKSEIISNNILIENGKYFQSLLRKNLSTYFLMSYYIDFMPYKIYNDIFRNGKICGASKFIAKNKYSQINSKDSK